MDLQALPVQRIALALGPERRARPVNHLLQRLNQLLLCDERSPATLRLRIGARSTRLRSPSAGILSHLLRRLCGNDNFEIVYRFLDASGLCRAKQVNGQLLHQLVIDVALRRVEVGATSAVVLPLLVVARGTHAVVLVVCVFSWPRDVFHRYLINAGQLAGFIEF